MSAEIYSPGMELAAKAFNRRKLVGWLEIHHQPPDGSEEAKNKIEDTTRNARTIAEIHEKIAIDEPLNLGEQMIYDGLQKPRSELPLVD